MKRIIKSENLDENRRTMVKFENVKNAFKLIFHSNLIEMGDFDKNCYQIVNLLTRAYGEIAFFVEKKATLLPTFYDNLTGRMSFFYENFGYFD